MAVPPSNRPIAVISSTVRDLPQHREKVMRACLRQGFFPKMMEDLPATDADAIAASLALVDEAAVYLGIFAYRYGYVPEDHDVSITEMEYDRAVERGIPRLIFLMGEDHPVKPADVEKDEGGSREIPEADLRRWLTESFADDPDWGGARGRRAVADFMKLVQERTGLLIDAGGDRYQFVHLSLHEYLVARYVLDRLDEDDSERVLRHYLHNPQWAEVNQLLVAGAPEARAESLVRAVLDEPCGGTCGSSAAGNSCSPDRAKAFFRQTPVPRSRGSDLALLSHSE